MREAIEKRISRRKYEDKPIPGETMQKINAEIEQINAESGLAVTFVADASDAFSSMKKSYGMFSGVKACIVMKGNGDLPDLAEKIGYYGEELILDLTDMDLGTCWVAGTFDSSKFTVPDGEKMLCVIPVGFVPSQSAKEKIIRRTISKNRKPAEARLQGYGQAPDWAKNAIEAVRLAPSAVNSQKPVFTYRDGTVTAAVAEETPIGLVDLGIAKKHFEIEAGGKFPFGNGAALLKNA